MPGWGNYLFRVEIHDVEYDAAGAPNRITLKWSRENGAEAARIGDTPPGFIAQDWVYEFYHSAAEQSASESHLGYHHPDVLSGWQPSRSTLTEGYPEGAEPPGYSLVRRWDGYVELVKSGATWQGATQMVDGEQHIIGADRGQPLSTTAASDVQGHLSEGSVVLLTLDTVVVSIELADLQHLAGDYWTAAVREAVHALGDTLLDQETPHGILHHYMCLADVAEGGIALLTKDDCKRFQFPRLTNLHAEDICFDNSVCEMPQVDNVQEAIDHLCQQRDLRWHNKHLHGWGIVCGLIVECCDDEEVAEAGHDENPRECVIVTKGYAIDCEGEDIVLSGKAHVDLIEEIRRHDEENPDTPILTDGSGTACLRIALENGQPVIRIEPHDPTEQSFVEQILDGTLLGDFIQHCVLDLIAALTEELSFLEDAQLPAQDGKTLVTAERRKLIAFGNLVIQTVKQQNGPYVWLSRREHEILKELYDSLRKILASKTFCAMFAGNAFPDYQFPDTQINTWFGADFHSRIKIDPSGTRAYTYGAGNAQIQVFDVKRGELVEIIDMNAPEGAEITAIACSPDGSLLYVAASIKGEDTILGVAQAGTKHTFERPMTVLCDLTITEMEVASDDPKLIYAIGKGRGLFRLRPDVLRDEEKPQPAPDFKFNAVGHMAIDPVTKRAFATSVLSQQETPDEIYDAYAVCDLSKGEASNIEQFFLRDLSGKNRSGTDGIAIRPGANAGGVTRLYAVVNGPGASDDKEIVTYDVPNPAGDGGKAIEQIAVENTQIALAYNPKTDALFASFEDSFRLQSMTSKGGQVLQSRIPVQVQPVDLAIGPDGNIYVANFLSNTVTAIPIDEVDKSKDRLTPLATYRWDIFKAFFSLVGNLLQSLKDCFCHHLLIKCPECDGSEKIYLACVEIRENLVYNICNFGKRKYVQTFMAWNYWLSILPIAALMKQAIAKVCCSVLPNFLDTFLDDVAPPPPPQEDGAKTGASAMFKAKNSRNTVLNFKRTDFAAIRRQQVSKLGLYGHFAGDVVVDSSDPATAKKSGIRKEVLIDSDSASAEGELKKAGINVVETRPYDPKLADDYAIAYARTPGRLQPGSDVILYVQDGKTVFIAEDRGVVRATLDPDAERKLAELEARADAIRDTSATEAEIAALDGKRATIAEEVTALEATVDKLQAERAAEEERIAKAQTEREALKKDLDELNAGLKSLSDARTRLRIEIDSVRPINELDGINAATAKRLENAGIRTIGDLAGTTAPKLRAANIGADVNSRRALINLAKARLK